MADLTTAQQATFDEAEVRAALRERLIEFARDAAFRAELDVPEDDQEFLTTNIPLDSLNAVEALSALDDILSVKVGQKVVRPGGYDSIQEALDHMVPRARAEWEKRKKGKK